MRKIIFLFLILIGVSCQNKSYNDQDLKSLKTDIISLSAVKLSSDSIIESANIVAYFNDKIVTRRYAENIFTIYNYDSNNNEVQQMGSFAKKGAGPNEFSGVAECFYDKRTNKLYLFDIKGGSSVKAYEVNLSSIDNVFKVANWRLTPFPKMEKSFMSTFAPLTDSTFIALGGDIESTNLLSLVHLNNDVEELNMHFPPDGINAKPITKRFVYNNGKILKHPVLNKFLYYCTNWGNYAEIFTLEDNRMVSHKAVTANYPSYKVASDGLDSESQMQTLMGMISYVTDHYIYLLPNFRTKEEYLKEYHNQIYPNDHSNEIYTFDWDGNYVRTYRLDMSVGEFVVSSDDSYLLSTSVDPKSGDIVFLRFDVK